MKAEYSSRFGDVAYKSNLKLYATDVGFSINYKRKIYNNMFVKIGMGYQEFALNKIDNKTAYGNITISTNSRPINYPTALFILYSTTKYRYNNLLFHFAAEKQFRIFPSLFLFTTVDYFHAYTFSQKYYIPGAGTYYRSGNQGSFGDYFNLDFGISKEFRKLAIAAALLVPIYKNWKQDIVFKEDPTKTVSNWFSGVGISISVSYHH